MLHKTGPCPRLETNSNKFRLNSEVVVMKKKLILTVIPLIILSALSWLVNLRSETNNDQTIKQNSHIKTKVEVQELDEKTILKYSKINSCYLPLLKDSSYFCKPRRSGFVISELYNDSLESNHPYNHRFLVADLMSLDDKMQSRGVKEKNPQMHKIFDARSKDSSIINAIRDITKLNLTQEQLHPFINLKYPSNADEIINFYTKVWKFLTPPLEKKYTFYNDKVYATGQKICLCELKKDTIELMAQFAVSAKKFGSVNSESVPIGDRRDYYGSQYRITSKCWDRDRRYELLDQKHDEKLGGGKKEITFYKGAVELPNFLLMEPDEKFPEAVRMNGIHQLALRELSMASLGSANSLGCIRVSNFGSKFIRWWVPKYANLFIVYQDDRYFKKLNNEHLKLEPPFKDSIEGNKFREWLYLTKPDKAIQLEIDSVGEYNNGHISYAYNIYGRLYEEYNNSLSPKTKEKKEVETTLLNQRDSKPKATDNLLLPKKIEEITENHAKSSPVNQPQRKGNIILGSFRNKQNALNFRNQLKSEGYNIVEIIPYNSTYRVAVVEINSKEKIFHQLKSIRKKYPNAWLIFISE